MLKWGMQTNSSVTALVRQAAQPHRRPDRDRNLNEMRLPKRAEENQGRTFVVRAVPSRVIELRVFRFEPVFSKSTSTREDRMRMQILHKRCRTFCSPLYLVVFVLVFHQWQKVYWD